MSEKAIFFAVWENNIHKLRQKIKQNDNKMPSMSEQQKKGLSLNKEVLQNLIDEECNKALTYIDAQLKKNEQDEKEQIYYFTKKGDAYKYKYEQAPNSKVFARKNSQDAYLKAYNLIKYSQSKAINHFQESVCMKLALQYSIFLSQIKLQVQKAAQLMNQALEKSNIPHLSSEQRNQTRAWDNLTIHYNNNLKKNHLKHLLQDQARNNKLTTKYEQIIFDYTHQKINEETLHEFKRLIQNVNLRNKIKGLFDGSRINFTQNRAVLHTALRAPIDSQLHDRNHPQIKEILNTIHQVLGNIKQFSQRIRRGEWPGATGKKLKNLIVIGIGGSYLSIQFVYEALRSHPIDKASANERNIRFLANVDPIDFDRAISNLNAEQTLILVNSKTFTTAQTMLNAKSCKQWLLTQFSKIGIKNEALISERHICACSTNIIETNKFGINKENVFGFWDFVGGRFSVWSSIGILPLSIHFGFDLIKPFLEGAHSIDKLLLKQASIQKNIPLLLGLIGFYRTTIQGFTARSIIPYCQALCKFAPHIQQLDMQSNGKRVNSKGQPIDYETAVVNFGQPGTNGQHSFFQLLHQGSPIPVQFIGFTKSQQPFNLHNNVSSHDQLMSNFFSQPDALAIGKTKEELTFQGVPQSLLAHKQFYGDRPSSSILFLGQLNAYKCGQLLAIYQHRTSVQGFIWDVNSYDQFGVELGKVLAKNVRQVLRHNGKNMQENIKITSTRRLVQQYLSFK